MLKSSLNFYCKFHPKIVMVRIWVAFLRLIKHQNLTFFSFFFRLTPKIPELKKQHDIIIEYLIALKNFPTIITVILNC